MEKDLLEQLMHYLEYNSQTGEFRWKVARKRVNAGSVAGCVDKYSGYSVIKCFGKKYYAHRLAWLMFYKENPKKVIDHIDGNKLNNKICNLRDVEVVVNSQNRRTCSNTSRLLGVSWRKDKSKYEASIKVNGVNKHLGYFLTKDEAHAVYLKAKRLLHKGCTI